jgi:hypothetical protein
MSDQNLSDAVSARDDLAVTAKSSTEHLAREREEQRERAALLQELGLEAAAAERYARSWPSTRREISSQVQQFNAAMAELRLHRPERSAVVAAACVLADELERLTRAATPADQLVKLLPALLAVQGAVGRLRGAERSSRDVSMHAAEAAREIAARR